MSERAATMDAVDCVCTALRALIAMRVLLAAQQPKLGCVAAHECAMHPCHHAWSGCCEIVCSEMWPLSKTI
jgi:hypothetical protein